MSARRFYLDDGPGERRGVVTLDGYPERLLIERPGELASLKLGARSVARIRKIERTFSSAFLALPGGGEALLALREGGPKFTEGAAIEVEIGGEAREGKLAKARLIGEASGEPRLIQSGPSLMDDLRHLAGEEGEIVTGRAARSVADLAAEAAMAVVHALPSGGSIAIEPTRALTAIDVDLGNAAGEAKKAARRANMEALADGARLLRLKGLGGLVVFDLVGKGHDAVALMVAARAAFTPDNPGAAIAPISRFGTMEVSLPRRRAPLDLTTPMARAGMLLRMVEREALADPGGRIEGAGDPAVVEAAKAGLAGLNARFGGRLSLRGAVGGKLEARAL
ncbi:MAG: RNA-binding protein [Caulobacteraceae bacterium]|nr:RNA-binding protein [Caulobacteraceae bacterium]